jgi:hypothetical protein
MIRNQSKTLASYLLALATTLGTNANAALTEWGANAYVSTADCPSFCTNFAFGPDNGSGGQQAVSAASSFSDDRGNANSAASFSGAGNTPVLKASAEASTGFHGAFGSAVAIQGYTFNGSTTQTLELTVDLTGQLTIPDAESDASLGATVALFSDLGFGYEEFYGNFFEFPVTWLTDTVTGFNAELSLIEGENGPVSKSGTLTFSVDPGDSFYLWAEINANAYSGPNADVIADGFNTLTMSFSDPSNLAPAAVPLPAAAWLFGSAVLGLMGGIARRKPS